MNVATVVPNLRPSDGASGVLNTPRRSRSKRMTLIAAFRTKEGIAICADSQETVPRADGLGEDRKMVQKISPITTDRYQVAIAGSGDAVLIEAFIILAKRRIEEDTAPASIKRVLTLIEDELGKFYEKHAAEVAAYPIKLFIVAACISTKEYEVWVTENRYLRPLIDAELIGWDATMYWVTIKRLYRKDMTLSQAILAAVYVLVVGEESSNYIKGPFSLTIVKENGISEEASDYVDTLRANLKEFEKDTSHILLACADSSIDSKSLQISIERYAKTAKAIHEKHIDAIAAQMFDKGLHNSASSISKIPTGTLIEVSPDGRHRVRHDVNGIEEMSRRVNEAIERQRAEEEEVKP